MHEKSLCGRAPARKGEKKSTSHSTDRAHFYNRHFIFMGTLSCASQPKAPSAGLFTKLKCLKKGGFRFHPIRAPISRSEVCASGRQLSTALSPAEGK